jgi:hypothetical protein
MGVDSVDFWVAGVLPPGGRKGDSVETPAANNAPPDRIDARRRRAVRDEEFMAKRENSGKQGGAGAAGVALKTGGKMAFFILSLSSFVRNEPEERGKRKNKEER